MKFQTHADRLLLFFNNIMFLIIQSSLNPRNLIKETAALMRTLSLQLAVWMGPSLNNYLFSYGTSNNECQPMATSQHNSSGDGLEWVRRTTFLFALCD